MGSFWERHHILANLREQTPQDRLLWAGADVGRCPHGGRKDGGPSVDIMLSPVSITLPPSLPPACASCRPPCALSPPPPPSLAVRCWINRRSFCRSAPRLPQPKSRPTVPPTDRPAHLHTSNLGAAAEPLSPTPPSVRAASGVLDPDSACTALPCLCPLLSFFPSMPPPSLPPSVCARLRKTSPPPPPLQTATEEETID